MKRINITPLLVVTVSLVWLLPACTSRQESEAKKDVPNYKPDDQKLYDVIVRQDSLYFHAYNTCDMAYQAAVYSDTLEFYHDKGGLDTSKTHILESLQKNICGKVTRELVPGTIEVYPIPGYGAVEMGQHKFHNNQEKEGTPSHPGKFVLLWNLQGDKWKIKRVISLH